MSTSGVDRRTQVVTAVGLLAVVVAGAFAVSANLGILSASSEPKVGALSAAGDLLPPTSTASPTTETATSATPTGPTPAIQRYAVDGAGVIAIRGSDPITIDHVEVNPGWSWRHSAPAGRDLAIDLADGSRVLHFSAVRSADGTITATLDETAMGAQPAAATSSVPAHEDEHEAHEQAEHEGRDEDD